MVKEKLGYTLMFVVGCVAEGESVCMCSLKPMCSCAKVGLVP